MSESYHCKRRNKKKGIYRTSSSLMQELGSRLVTTAYLVCFAPVDSHEQTPLSEQLLDLLLTSSEDLGGLTGLASSVPVFKPTVALASQPTVPADEDVNSEEERGEPITRCNCGLPD